MRQKSSTLNRKWRKTWIKFLDKNKVNSDVRTQEGGKPKTWSYRGDFINVGLLNSVVWVTCLLGMATPTLAQIENNSSLNSPSALPSRFFLASNDPMSQVPSVSQLRDVEPTQWAYEALRSLVERYGCIVGYPNNLYRGARALTRWEFATALNSCLNTLEGRLQQNLTVQREDIEKFKRLSDEFKEELGVLATKGDNLTARTTFLENNQFSTTTKLFTQVIWSLDDTFGDKVGEDEDESQTQFAYRIRFNLETSFSGQDLLRTRLQVGNITPTSEVTGTYMTRFNYDDDSNNKVFVTHLLYRTPLTDNLQLTAGPVGVGYTDITDTLMPPSVPDDSRGIPSRFGEYNPLYRRGGRGGAINWNIIGSIEGASIGPSDPNRNDLILTIGYLSLEEDNSLAGSGFFRGGYNALAQLAYYEDWGAVGFAYSHSYGPSGRVDVTGRNGTFNATQPFGDSIAAGSDSLNVQGYVRLTDNVVLHGWVGYYQVDAKSNGISNISNGVGGTIPVAVSKSDEAQIWNAALSLTFPDVTGEGNLPGILLGIPPTVSDSDVRRDRDTSYHIEVFYRWQVNDYIAITPGFWVIVNPEGDSRNDTQWVGHIRTGFNF